LFFCFDFIYQSPSFNRELIERLGVESGDGRVGKGYQILGTDEKSKSGNIIAFHPALKFDTLSCGFVFLRMP
jgi:hypothetical protein